MEFLIGLMTIPTLIMALGLFGLFLAREAVLVAGLVLVVAEGILWFLGAPNLTKYILTHPGDAAIYAATYLGIGVLWSLFKFDRLGKAAAKNFAQSWSKTNRPADERKYALTLALPRVDQNKELITSWVLLWWASMLGFVFNGLIDEIWNVLVNSLGKIYNALAQRHFKEFE